jgi:hypothetical protein
MFITRNHPIIILPCDISPLGYNDENELDLSTNYGFDAYNTGNNFRHKPRQIVVISETDDVFVDDYILYNGSIEKIQGVDDDDFYINNKSFRYPKNNIQKIIAVFPKFEELPTLSIQFIKRWIKNQSSEICVNYCQQYHPVNMNRIREINWNILIDQNNEISCLLPNEKQENPMVVTIRPIEEIARDYCFEINDILGTTNFSIEDIISACSDFAMSDDVKDYWFREFNKRKQC